MEEESAILQEEERQKHELPYMDTKMEIVVLGASGDLAKKKTYPALLDLFHHQFLSSNQNLLCIYGYARTAMSNEAFRTFIRPFLLNKCEPEVLEAFLSRCFYFSGGYDSVEAFSSLHQTLNGCSVAGPANRLFYFAIPPNVFIPCATAIRQSAMAQVGWTRIIVEKPFGHDLKSAVEMSRQLGALFSEDQIYRIDHYLGKEMVQNLIMFRFGNIFLEPLMNHRYVHNIQITFKEDFGTDGRGGYFDNYGIVRDILQNHLMQVLSILAMEPPVQVSGPLSSNYVRDAKVNVLKSISTPTAEDVVLGQYVADDKGHAGYLDDPTVPSDSQTPTFAQVVLRVNTPRWDGVPFIMKAGKALDERKAEIRIQFKDAPASTFLFNGQNCPRNELIFRLQPSEAVYFKINVKQPGLSNAALQSELDLSYKKRYQGIYNPDAYTRLILDALRGNQSVFVRSDELEESWKLFDPLLKQIDDAKILKKQQQEQEGKAGGGNEFIIPVHDYVYGSRGPAKASEAVRDLGFRRHDDYLWEER